MFADLPTGLKEEVLELLQKNNFPAAKALYDAYHLEHSAERPLHKKKPSQQSPAETTSST